MLAFWIIFTIAMLGILVFSLKLRKKAAEEAVAEKDHTESHAPDAREDLADKDD